MQKILSVLLMLCCSFLLCFNVAEAKRFGGGKSFGMQRTIQQPRATTPSSIAQHATSPMKKWLGPLAGLAMGGLLAYFMMSHGLGSGLLAWLAVGALILFIFQFIKNRNRQNAFQTASPVSPYAQQASDLHQHYQAPMPSSSYAPRSFATPADFNETSFLRDMKAQFLRLQTAYDQKDLADIREFTTPEVFSEVQLQLQERGAAENKTTVINLDAKLLDFIEEFQVPVASVEFSGLIEELPKTEPVPFNETWHFRRDIISKRWFVAGIEQHSTTH